MINNIKLHPIEWANEKVHTMGYFFCNNFMKSETLKVFGSYMYYKYIFNILKHLRCGGKIIREVQTK